MTVLVITDVQHDFVPGGALGIPGADRIIPLINALMPRFDHIVATMDWHPSHHVSFAATHHKQPGESIRIGSVEQILWPIHCVQHTWGAALVEGLKQDRIERLFYKGINPAMDSYSVFFDSARHRSTGLVDYLHQRKLKDLYFVGLATDYCVLYSVLDALELGFRVTVIRDACAAINLKAGDEDVALFRMQEKGARIILSSEMRN